LCKYCETRVGKNHRTATGPVAGIDHAAEGKESYSTAGAFTPSFIVEIICQAKRAMKCVPSPVNCADCSESRINEIADKTEAPEPDPNLDEHIEARNRLAIHMLFERLISETFDLKELTDTIKHFIELMSEDKDEPEKSDFRCPQDCGYFKAYIEEEESLEPEPLIGTIRNMSFSSALSHCKDGYKIARKGWNGKNMWIELEGGKKYFHRDVPDRLPYLVIIYPVGHPAYPEGAVVPWLASQTDLLADDWCVVG